MRTYLIIFFFDSVALLKDDSRHHSLVGFSSKRRFFRMISWSPDIISATLQILSNYPCISKVSTASNLVKLNT